MSFWFPKRRYSAVALFSQDLEHVLLIHKQKPAWQAGKANFPGGKVDAGETPEQALVRELEEELGIRLFVRQNRTLSLTPEAKEYLPGIRAAFNDLRLATDRLLRKDDGNVLTVSTLASLAAAGLPVMTTIERPSSSESSSDLTAVRPLTPYPITTVWFFTLRFQFCSRIVSVPLRVRISMVVDGEMRRIALITSLRDHSRGSPPAAADRIWTGGGQRFR